MEQIIISAYRMYDGDKHISLMKLLNTINWDMISTPILRLHDHKGTLSVVWKGKPRIDDMQYLEDIWEIVFFEPITEHFTSDNEFLKSYQE